MATPSWLKRLATLAVGVAGYQASDQLFDFVLYPVVVAWLGPIKGGLVMTVASALICYALIVFYRWSNRDWLGMEWVKEVRDGDPTTFGLFKRAFRWTLRRGHVVAFIVLAIKTDPFVTVSYFHRKSDDTKMSGRDWRIFWSSLVISNVAWIILCSGGVEMVKSLWRLVGG